MSDPDQLLSDLAQAVIALDPDQVQAAAAAALAAGLPASRVISAGLSRGMAEIGRQWDCGAIYLPEVMAACQGYYVGLAALTPYLAQERAGQASVGTIVIGAIRGDIHSLGKDVAGPVFRAAGFRVIDLGVDVAAEKFVEAAVAHQADVIGLAASMSLTLRQVPEVVAACQARGLRDRTLLICGGPVVDDEPARALGADGGFNDAWAAATALKRMLGGSKEKYDG